MIKLNGRRGAFQLLYGIAYIAIGYILTIPRPGVPNQFIHEIIPIWLKLIIWGTAGITAIICAFLPHSKASIIAFTVLSLPLAWRVSSYILTAIFFNVDIRPVLSGVIIYGAMLFALQIVASWPEPKAGMVMLRGAR